MLISHLSMVIGYQQVINPLTGAAVYIRLGGVRVFKKSL